MADTIIDFWHKWGFTIENVIIYFGAVYISP